jgi:pilus assembly protein CpaB
VTPGRRAAAMLGASAICAGLAVSAVDRYAGDIESHVGPLVPVVVAARDIPRGTAITPAVASASLAERQVPQRFAPPGALAARAEVVGLEAASAMKAGDYVGVSQLRSPAGKSLGGSGARGSRAGSSGDARLVEVAVAGARTLPQVLRAGAKVDVLITTDRGRAGPRTFVALQRMPVVGFESGGPGSLGDESRVADGRVTLRATLRQAVLLTAADNFAREVRVVPRAPGDTRRLGPVSIAASGLGS